jgi:DNA-binding PadR family transcriptional regulator
MCGDGHCGCGQVRCWHDYPERGWIQFLILRLLYERPSYGYQLLEMLEEKTLGLQRLETGSMYTLLRRMEQRGLLKSEWQHAEKTGPNRRVYRVTKSGSEALGSGLRAVAKRKALMDDLARFYEKNFKNRKRG